MATAAIGMGLGFLGNLLGGFGASRAARQASEADTKAATIAQQRTDAALGINRQTASDIASQLSPYTSAGSSAFSTVGNLMQEGAAGTGPLASWNENFQAPTNVTEANDPGYAFRLQQGQQALEASAAARGGLNSTGTGKQLIDYGQNYASGEYGNVYNRALGEYQQRYQTFLNNQNNLYSRLMGIGSTGLQAAGTQASADTALSGQYGQTELGGAQLQGGYTAAAGGAQAAGTAGMFNSVGNAMGGLGGGIMSLPQSTSAVPMPNGGSWTTPSGGYGPNPVSPVPLGGAYAFGGRVPGRKPILVGEHGPEVWTPPRKGGYILPNPRTVAGLMR